MAKFGNSKWRKLDNAALAFPAVSGKNDTRVFRFYCQLKEEINPDSLQAALDVTMEKYPLFQTVLRKGLFWFYLEHRDIKPLVVPEKKPPCSRLYIPDKKSLLFEVSYYKDRINFEVYHALTDGTGAMYFLESLVQNYLKIAHPEVSFPELHSKEVLELTEKDMAEDSFSQYYTAGPSKLRTDKKAAIQLKGEKATQDQMPISETVISVKDTLAKARAYGVSITVLLSSMLIWAIHEEIPKNRLKKPITLMVPVNLRKHFPSQSMSNFFGWLEIGYTFQQDTTFQEVLLDVKEQFQRELTKERLASHINELVSLEKNPFLRIVPLEAKLFFLRIGTRVGGRSITGVYSNVGIIQLPDEYHPFIQKFGFFTSTDAIQLCSCSYEDNLVLGFTSRIASDSIQRNFLQLLQQEELPFREEPNDFPGAGKQSSKTSIKIFKSFTFLCITIAIICGMANFMINKEFSWSLFVGGGCLCTWIIVAIAFYKRRSVLKNIMWELFFLSAGGVLWDVFTSWHGWSIDFLLPLASLAAICSIPLIAKLCRLASEEYLFYMIQACLFGFIPLVLLLFRVPHIVYPSVICTGISLLTVCGLIIFRLKEVRREFHKKFRM